VAGLLGFLTLAAWAESSESRIQSLWDQGLFNSPAASILKVVQDAQFFPDKNAVVLYAQGEIRFTSQGSEVRTSRLVYRIQSQEAVNSWGGTQLAWSPWRQDEPTIRVRVINPDGSVWNLDPTTLVTGQAGSDGEGVYTDQKTLQGPYPHVQVGSIIEEEITTVSHPLLAGSGIFDRWNFGSSVPVLVEELKLEVARGLEFHLQTCGPQKLPWNESSSAQAKTWQVTLTHLLPLKDPENGLPRDVRLTPVVAFSTAPPWEKLSNLYGKLIDQKIQASPVSLPPGLSSGSDLADTAVKLTRWVNSQVRYVGLELGQNSIIPYSPQEILKRGYGDCKDKAVLLTALLRKAGYKASVALLWDGSNSDIFPEVPGLDQFDHAIVWVDAKTPLWLDPTSDYSRGTTLPPWDQNRRALVTKIGGEALLTTPSPVPQDVTETRTYTLKDFGRCSVQETTVYHGGLDVYFRQQYAFADPEETQKKMSKYAEEAYGGQLTSVSFSPPKDLDKPFTFTVDVDHSSRGWTGENEATLQLKPAYLLTWIDAALSDPKAPARLEPYHAEIPLVYHWKNIIHSPLGFGLRHLPQNLDKDFGEFHLHRQASVSADGILTIEWTLSTPTGEMTADQFEKARQAFLADTQTFAPISVEFEDQGYKSYVEHHFRQAFDQYRALIAQNPKNAMVAVRYSKVLLDAGFTDQAVFWAQRAVDLEPKTARFSSNLGFCLEFDSVGRMYGPGWPRPQAIAAYQKALVLDPKDWRIHVNYALLLERNAAGLRYSDPKDLELALEQYDLALPQLAESDFEVNPVFVLFRLGRWEEVLKRAAQLSRPISKWGFTLAVQALQKGSSLAISQVANWGLDTKTLEQTEELAAELLIQQARYPDASVLLRQEALLSNDSARLNQRADFFAKLQKTPKTPEPVLQPQNFYPTYLQLLCQSQGKDFSVFQKIMEPDLVTLLSQNKGYITQSWIELAQNAIDANLPLRFYRDSAMMFNQQKIQGSSDDGYHVTLWNEQQKFQDGFFLLRSGSVLKAAALSLQPYSLAKPLQDFLNGQKNALAIQWLEWFFENVHQNDPFFAKTLKTLWDSPRSTQTEGLQIMVDALRASMPQTDADVAPAVSDLSKLKGDQKVALVQVIAKGLLANPNLLVPQVVPEILQNDNSFLGQRFYQYLLIRMGQFDKLEKSLKEAIAQNPSSPQIQQQLLHFYFSRPDAPAARDFLKKEGLTLTVPQDNSLAWAELFEPQLPPQALETALKATGPGMLNRREALNTLATVWAESDRPDQAKRVLLEYLGSGGLLQPEDWYILARNAQTYGLYDVAEADYKKALTQSPYTTSVTVLAERRLAELASQEQKRQK
jgi:tetratricopeptide (TPR) repeat protein